MSITISQLRLPWWNNRPSQVRESYLLGKPDQPPALTKFQPHPSRKTHRSRWLDARGTGLLTHIQLGLLDHIRANDYDGGFNRTAYVARARRR